MLDEYPSSEESFSKMQNSRSTLVRTFSFIPQSNNLNLRKDRETDIEMFK